MTESAGVPHGPTAAAYLDSAEPAVRHFFAGLAQYDSLWLPSITNFVDETGVVRMTRQENEAFLRAYEDHFALEFARATLAGSILQIAHMALKQYAPPTQAVTECVRFGIAPGTYVERFCAGRQVHSIPIGLLIYAGRVQYNHWDSGEPTGAVARNVFRELAMAYGQDANFDMAYELEWPAPRPVSQYILRLELRWRSYDDYLSDVRALLGMGDRSAGSA